MLSLKQYIVNILPSYATYSSAYTWLSTRRITTRSIKEDDRILLNHISVQPSQGGNGNNPIDAVGIRGWLVLCDLDPTLQVIRTEWHLCVLLYWITSQVCNSSTGTGSGRCQGRDVWTWSARWRCNLTIYEHSFWGEGLLWAQTNIWKGQDNSLFPVLVPEVFFRRDTYPREWTKLSERGLSACFHSGPSTQCLFKTLNSSTDNWCWLVSGHSLTDPLIPALDWLKKYTLTFRAFSRRFYPKRLTTRTFVRRKRNNTSLSVQERYS